MLESKSICPSCMEGKKSREHIVKIVEHRATRPLALVHINLCGMIHPVSLGGVHYFISFTYDFSYFTWLYILKQKSKALQLFKNFCAKVEFQFIPLKLLALHNNRGGKYFSRYFLIFCIEASISHELNQAYTPSHNGVLECKNFTFFEKARRWWLMHKPPCFFGLMWLTL